MLFPKLLARSENSGSYRRKQYLLMRGIFDGMKLNTVLANVPVNAVADADSGLTRYTSALGKPLLPLKLRFVVRTVTPFVAGLCPIAHQGPQASSKYLTPASNIISIYPLRSN